MTRVVRDILLAVVAASFCLGCGIVSRLTGPPKYPEMVAIRKELLAVKPTGSAVVDELRGKVAIVVQRDKTSRETLDRFGDDGRFADDQTGVSGSYNFLPYDLYAKKPDEIETLIKIYCASDTETATYSARPGGPGDRSISFDKYTCPVEVIDYRSKKLISSQTFDFGGAPDTVTVGKAPERKGFPEKEISEYLQSFNYTLMPLEKPTPSGETVEASALLSSGAGYVGRVITVTGYTFGGPTDELISINPKPRVGSDYISCRMGKTSIGLFRGLKPAEYAKVSVVGKYSMEGPFPTLDSCKLVSSEPVERK